VVVAERGGKGLHHASKGDCLGYEGQGSQIQAHATSLSQSQTEVVEKEKEDWGTVQLVGEGCSW